MRKINANERFENLKKRLGDHGIVDCLSYWASDEQIMSFVLFLENSIKFFKDSDGNELFKDDIVMASDSIDDYIRVGDLLKVNRLIDLKDNEIEVFNLNSGYSWMISGENVKKLYYKKEYITL